MKIGIINPEEMAINEAILHLRSKPSKSLIYIPDEEGDHTILVFLPHLRDAVIEKMGTPSIHFQLMGFLIFIHIEPVDYDKLDALREIKDPVAEVFYDTHDSMVHS